MTKKPIAGFFAPPSTEEDNSKDKAIEASHIDRRVFIKRTGAATLGAAIGAKILTPDLMAYRFYSIWDYDTCDHSTHSKPILYNLSEEFQEAIGNLMENYGPSSTIDPNPLATWFKEGIDDAATQYSLLLGKTPNGLGQYELSLEDFGEHAFKYALKKYRDEIIHPWALSTFPATMNLYERAEANAAYWIPAVMAVAAPLYTRATGSPASITIDIGDVFDSALSGSYDCGGRCFGLLTWKTEGQVELEWKSGQSFPSVESWGLFFSARVEWGGQ